MTSRKLVLGATALWLAAISRTALAAGAPAEEKTPPKESFAKYQVLVTNNIFVRDRARYAPGDFAPVPVAPALSPEEATVLRGIVRQGEGTDAAYFVFLEDIRTQETTKMRVSDLVCAGKLANPTLDSVDYVRNGITTRIEIGKNLTEADAAPASVPPAATSSATQPTPVNGAGVSPSVTDGAANSLTVQPLSRSTGASSVSTAPPASLDSVAEQMRQKRLKELGK